MIYHRAKVPIALVQLAIAIKQRFELNAECGTTFFSETNCNRTNDRAINEA
jgi:hypothetical protein